MVSSDLAGYPSKPVPPTSFLRFQRDTTSPKTHDNENHSQISVKYSGWTRQMRATCNDHGASSCATLLVDTRACCATIDVSDHAKLDESRERLWRPVRLAGCYLSSSGRSRHAGAVRRSGCRSAASISAQVSTMQPALGNGSSMCLARELPAKRTFENTHDRANLASTIRQIAAIHRLTSVDGNQQVSEVGWRVVQRRAHPIHARSLPRVDRGTPGVHLEPTFPVSSPATDDRFRWLVVHSSLSQTLEEGDR